MSCIEFLDSIKVPNGGKTYGQHQEIENINDNLFAYWAPYQTSNAIDRGHEAQSAAGGMDAVTEKDLLSSVSNGEIAMLEVQRRLDKERARKQSMADEGKPHPIAEARIEKYEAQLADLGSFDATNSIDFKAIPSTKDLMYLASSVYLDAIFGDGKGEIYGLTDSAWIVEALEKQYGELHAEIVKIERCLEKK